MQFGDLYKKESEVMYYIRQIKDFNTLTNMQKKNIICVYFLKHLKNSSPLPLWLHVHVTNF